MTDLRDILGQEPLPAPLDPAAVSHRAGQLRRRGRALRSALAATIVAAVGVVGFNLATMNRDVLPSAPPSHTAPPTNSPLPEASASPALPPNPYDVAALASWADQWGFTEGVAIEHELMWTRMHGTAPSGVDLYFLWQPHYSVEAVVPLACAGDLLSVACEPQGDELLYLRDYPEGRFLVAERLLPDGARLAGAVVGTSLADPEAEQLVQMLREFEIPDGHAFTPAQEDSPTPTAPVETVPTAPSLADVPAYQVDLTDPLG